MNRLSVAKLLVRVPMACVITGMLMAQSRDRLMAQSRDRFALKSSNGIAFSEFEGYESWPVIATSQAGDDGCGTSKVGCMKAILGNPTMIQAFRAGIPDNGKPFPDGAMVAKVEWLKDRNADSPYEVTVPGVQTEVGFMLKDSKRFRDTNGWGYATLQFDAVSRLYKPSANTTNLSFGKTLCHQCHTTGASARDFVYTSYAQR